MEKFPFDAFLLCNGEPPSKKLCTHLLHDSRLFIAADGGANAARAMGLRPDVIIGDFDSISSATKTFFNTALILHVGRQDNTDMEKALDFCVDQHLSRVIVAGVTGGRIDMTLGNMSALWKYVGRLDLVVCGDGWVGFPVVGLARIAVRPGATVSLIPFGEIRGVSLKGLKYSLNGATLKPGDVAVSNTATGHGFSVDVARGKVLVIVFDERATRMGVRRKAGRQ